MKILLINPTIRENHLPFNFPTGLGIIAAIMRREGHDVCVYDQNALRVSNEVLCHNLKKIINVDVVGIGGLITTYSHLKQLIPGLRQIFPKANIVLGGGVTVSPEVIFENMHVDFCIHGEGEHTFRELCAAIERQEQHFSNINGISYVEKAEVITTAPRPVEKDLDQFPMPAYNLFPTEIYFNNNVIKNLMRIKCGNQRCATLLWSRGCPNQCTFCWRMMARTLRHRSISLVMKEIAYLRSEYAVDSYLFYDECINANRKQSIKFFQALIENGYAAPWYSHARALNLDDELVDIFKRSGCVGLNFGIESGSQLMLTKMKKNVSPIQASQAISTAKRYNIKTICTFIIGMPGESRETVLESIQWIRRNHVQQYVYFFATPYPGTDLYNETFIKKRIIEKYKTLDSFFSKLGDALDFCVNMTDLTDSELLKLKDWAQRKSTNGNYLQRIKHFLIQLCLLLFKPRLWKKTFKDFIRRLSEIAYYYERDFCD